MKVIHLQTQRIAGNKPNGELNVEQKTVKLADGDVFNDFVKHLKLGGYRIEESNKPIVVNVIDTYTKIDKVKDDFDRIQEIVNTKSKELKEEIAKYQKIVDEAIKPKQTKAINGEDVNKLKAENEALEARLAKLEAALGTPKNNAPEDDKDTLIAEIIDRGGKADKRMGIEKLESILTELKEAE